MAVDLSKLPHYGFQQTYEFGAFGQRKQGTLKQSLVEAIHDFLRLVVVAVAYRRHRVIIRVAVGGDRNTGRRVPPFVHGDFAF